MNKTYTLPQHAQVHTLLVSEDNKITNSTLLVYAFLCLRMDYALRRIEGWTYSGIADALKLSPDTVKNSIKELVKKGIIAIERKGKKNYSAVYIMKRYDDNFEMFSDKFLLSPTLTNKQKVALMRSQFIMDKENFKIETKSKKELSDILGVHRRYVDETLKDLESNNLIEVEQDGSIDYKIDSYNQGFLRNLDRRVSYTTKKVKAVEKKLNGVIQDLNKEKETKDKEIQALQYEMEKLSAKLKMLESKNIDDLIDYKLKYESTPVAF